jgi:hypothetical protein
MESDNLTTNAGNTGLGIGIIHYLNFSYLPNVIVILLKHTLMITLNYRSELSYKTKLRQFGEFVEINFFGQEQLKVREEVLQ